MGPSDNSIALGTKGTAVHMCGVSNVTDRQTDRQTHRQKRIKSGCPTAQDPGHNTTRITWTKKLTTKLVYPWQSSQVTTTPACFPRPLQLRGREASSEPSHRRIFTRSSQPTLASTRFAQFSRRTHLFLDPSLCWQF